MDIAVRRAHTASTGAIKGSADWRCIIFFLDLILIVPTFLLMRRVFFCTVGTPWEGGLLRHFRLACATRAKRPPSVKRSPFVPHGHYPVLATTMDSSDFPIRFVRGGYVFPRRLLV